MEITDKAGIVDKVQQQNSSRAGSVIIPRISASNGPQRGGLISHRKNPETSTVIDNDHRLFP
jgi:hypothetical protein